MVGVIVGATIAVVGALFGAVMSVRALVIAFRANALSKNQEYRRAADLFDEAAVTMFVSAGGWFTMTLGAIIAGTFANT